jgi:hypothetical protein
LVVEQDYLNSCAGKIILAEAGEPNWLTWPGMTKLAQAGKVRQGGKSTKQVPYLIHI